MSTPTATPVYGSYTVHWYKFHGSDIRIAHERPHCFSWVAYRPDGSYLNWDECSTQANARAQAETAILRLQDGQR